MAGGDCKGSCGSESSVAGGGTVGGGATAGWPLIHDSHAFIEEVWRRGEPALRPDCGRIVLARTAGMAATEDSYRGRALFVTVEGEMRVMAAALLAAMEDDCGVQQSTVKVEVICPPFHFFVRFDSEEDCTRVVLSDLHSGGTHIRFRCWSRCAHGTSGKMEYTATLSIEGLPEEAQEPQAVNLANVHRSVLPIEPESRSFSHRRRLHCWPRRRRARHDLLDERAAVADAGPTSRRADTHGPAAGHRRLAATAPLAVAARHGFLQTRALT